MAHAGVLSQLQASEPREDADVAAAQRSARLADFHMTRARDGSASSPTAPASRTLAVPSREHEVSAHTHLPRCEVAQSPVPVLFQLGSPQLLRAQPHWPGEGQLGLSPSVHKYVCKLLVTLMAQPQL